MSIRLVPEVLVVDPLDGELQEWLNACGMCTTRASSTELAALVQQTARQPHVVVVDTRGGGGIPPLTAAVKRQRPGIGLVVVASESDPTMLLEAMRAGATEYLQEPLTQAALEQAILRLVARRDAAPISGEALRLANAS